MLRVLPRTQILIGQAFHIDHIVPQSADGEAVSDNLCLACPHCNIAKRNRTEAQDPRTRREVPLFNPRTYRWFEHFRWSADWTRLIGRRRWVGPQWPAST